jgi:hypothetical protein
LSLDLDASALVTILIEEQSSAGVETFLAEAQSDLWVSTFGSAQVASAISRLVRMGNIVSVAGEASLARHDAWVAGAANLADIEGDDVRQAARLVRRFDLMLRTPDALHLAVCQRLGARLVTLDRRLTKTAERLGIGVAAI